METKILNAIFSFSLFMTGVHLIGSKYGLNYFI